MVLTVDFVGTRFDSGCPHGLIMSVFSNHITSTNINTIIIFDIIQIY